MLFPVYSLAYYGEGKMTTEQEYAYYKARYNYQPSKEEIDQGYLIITKDEILRVERPVKLDEGTEDDPKSWLVGLNLTTKKQGYFPGTFVEKVAAPVPSGTGKKPVPTPTPRQKPKLLQPSPAKLPSHEKADDSGFCEGICHKAGTLKYMCIVKDLRVDLG